MPFQNIADELNSLFFFKKNGVYLVGGPHSVACTIFRATENGVDRLQPDGVSWSGAASTFPAVPYDAKRWFFIKELPPTALNHVVWVEAEHSDPKLAFVIDGPYLVIESGDGGNGTVFDTAGATMRAKP